MTKGTTSMGKKSKGKTHIICRRCGNHSFHASKRVCSSCGFGSNRRIRRYNWAKVK